MSKRKVHLASYIGDPALRTKKLVVGHVNYADETAANAVACRRYLVYPRRPDTPAVWGQGLLATTEAGEVTCAQCIKEFPRLMKEKLISSEGSNL